MNENFCEVKSFWFSLKYFEMLKGLISLVTLNRATENKIELRLDFEKYLLGNLQI